MTESLSEEHQDLLQFLYQLPVGIVDLTDDGEVRAMNPAAVRLLSTVVTEAERLDDPLPILRRVAPELLAQLLGDRSATGSVGTGRGQDVDGGDGVSRFTVSAYRMGPDRVVLSLSDVTEERRLLLEQRERARRLQRALLGRIDLNRLELSVSYLPANRDDLSGGDWYDVIGVDEHRFGLVVGDVVGHDIEASATMGQLRAVVRAFAMVDPDPGHVLDRTEDLARTIQGASYASVHYALLDPSEGLVSYASAGHPPPIVVSADGSSDVLLHGRRPVLTARAAKAPSVATRRLVPGDTLVMYTDGLLERRGETLDVGLERLAKVSSGLAETESIDEFVEQLTTEMLADTNHHDDVCVLAVRHSA